MIRYAEGFDAISLSHVLDKANAMTGVGGSAYAGSGTNAISSTAAYSSGNSLQLTGNETLTIQIDNQATYYVCFHWAYYGSGTCSTILILQDTGSVQLAVDAQTGVLRLKNGSGTVLATGTTAMTTGVVFHYIQFSGTINNTTGSSQCYVDGVLQWNLTSTNTRTTGNNYANQVVLDGVGFGNVSGGYFDNVLIMDAQGSSFNGFPTNEQRISTYLPSAAGTYAQFTPSSGSNYAKVNESPDDGDTSYNAASTAGKRDSFTKGSLSSGTPQVVIQTAIFRKDDVSARQIALTMRMSSVDYDGTAVIAASAYGVACQVYATNGPDGNAWTATGFNNAEIGYKEVV